MLNDLQRGQDTFSGRNLEKILSGDSWLFWQNQRHFSIIRTACKRFFCVMAIFRLTISSLDGNNFKRLFFSLSCVRSNTKGSDLAIQSLLKFFVQLLFVLALMKINFLSIIIFVKKVNFVAFYQFKMQKAQHPFSACFKLFKIK